MRYEVRHDPAKNRLYVVLEGLFSEDETREACDRIVAGVLALWPGADIINDMSMFRPITQTSLSHVRRVGEAVAKSRVRTVVRVVGLSSTAARQIQRETHEAGGYLACQVATLAEAEALLDANHKK